MIKPQHSLRHLQRPHPAVRYAVLLRWRRGTSKHVVERHAGAARNLDCPRDEHASLYSTKLHVANPVCPDDVFTDRWPESTAQQSEFASHLRELVRTVSVGLPDSAYTNRELGAAPA